MIKAGRVNSASAVTRRVRRTMKSSSKFNSEGDFVLPTCNHYASTRVSVNRSDRTPRRIAGNIIAPLTALGIVR
jgi:hypothetical protein